MQVKWEYVYQTKSLFNGLLKTQKRASKGRSMVRSLFAVLYNWENNVLVIEKKKKQHTYHFILFFVCTAVQIRARVFVILQVM